MANELRHVTVGTELTQAEYESVTGHAFASQATGDVLYASSATQLTRLAVGAANAVLNVSGGIPAWTNTPTFLGLTVGDVTFSADTAPAGTSVYAVHDNTGDLTLNALTGKTINLAINAVDIFQLGAATLTFPASINIAGTTSIIFNDVGNDVDHRFEGDNNANLLVLDAGADCIAFGAAVNANSFIVINGSAVNRAFGSTQGTVLSLPAETYTGTNADPTTIANLYGVLIGRITFAGANANQVGTTVTAFGALAPTAGTNYTFTKAYAIRSVGGILLEGSALATQPQTSAAGALFELPTTTQAATNASGTLAIGAIASLGVVSLTNSAATLTYTDIATLYIAGIPAASTNVSFSDATNGVYALWVDAGNVRFDGKLSVGVSAVMWSTLPAGGLAVSGGVMVGANSLNNLIDDASGGAGSTPLYIGNAVILVGNGVSFGPAAVTSITVVNGQITAIS